MDKTAAYRSVLRSLPDWEPYLRAESGLPGPRGNLELALTAADEATPAQIEQLLSNDPETAPENTPGAFLAMCGAILRTYGGTSMLLNPAEWLRLEKAFLDWADTQPALRAAIAVGSRERSDPPPDEWSDLDLMLYLTNPEDFARQPDWIESLGEPWATVPNRLPSGEAEWLVTFAGGYNVDFVLLDAGGLGWLAQADPLPEPFARGYRILVDKDGLAARIPPATGSSPVPALPSEEEFNRAVAGFWYTAFYIAKQLSRGDLFVAKVRQGNLNEILMGMLSWHAQVTRGTGVDIWHMGRFMERWADPQALSELPALFAHYDAPDSWRALLAALPLFRRLAQETAARLRYPYPTTLDEQLSTLVETLAHPFS